MLELDQAIIVIEKASKLQDIRLHRGMLRRQQLVEAMANGAPVSGPRVDWLLSAAGRINEVLMEEAEKFNDANPDDMASAQDLYDVVINVLARFEKAAKK
jgi:hypothetical protein